MPARVACREASRLLSLACDRSLSESEAGALQYHLGRCLMCRNFEAQLRFLHKASERFRAGGGD